MRACVRACVCVCVCIIYFGKTRNKFYRVEMYKHEKNTISPEGNFICRYIHASSDKGGDIFIMDYTHNNKTMDLLKDKTYMSKCLN